MIINVSSKEAVTLITRAEASNLFMTAAESQHAAASADSHISALKSRAELADKVAPPTLAPPTMTPV